MKQSMKKDMVESVEEAVDRAVDPVDSGKVDLEPASPPLPPPAAA